jgi:undecaprenyl-diphosphatase
MNRKTLYIVTWAAIFIVFTILVVKGIFDNIDLAMADFIKSIADPPLDKIFSTLRELAGLTSSILLALAISAYSFFKRSKKFAVFFLVIFLILLGTGQGLKDLIKKERPSQAEKNFSYPSGHTLRASYLLFVLAMLTDKARLSKKAKQMTRRICYGLIILVGFSSIYVGAHWLSDIIGGCILGYIFYLALLLF